MVLLEKESVVTTRTQEGHEVMAIQRHHAHGHVVQLTSTSHTRYATNPCVAKRATRVI